jgi:hypothetical protein
MRYKSFRGRAYNISSPTFRKTYMNHDDQAMHKASYASAATIKRMLAALTFLLGGFAAELAKPVNCNLIHRPSAQQRVRRQQEPS